MRHIDAIITIIFPAVAVTQDQAMFLQDAYTYFLRISLAILLQVSDVNMTHQRERGLVYAYYELVLASNTLVDYYAYDSYYCTSVECKNSLAILRQPALCTGGERDIVSKLAPCLSHYPCRGPPFTSTFIISNAVGVSSSASAGLFITAG